MVTELVLSLIKQASQNTLKAKVVSLFFRAILQVDKLSRGFMVFGHPK